MENKAVLSSTLEMRSQSVNINHRIIINITPYEVDITLIEAQEVMEYWEKWKVIVGQFWSQQRNIA
ncbi:hypothetical protein [Planktothrix paucivesiculata]|uniref:Uncharacterized protein n=1 Tax=Planktothrix paucivesiculata PCC 9631 TaxID=671071 RepID=A0A7Z9E0Y1_9CYAN|nr:hypothetical protein [Planktothrix paucivesiculata]VXD22177.1 hypothetical protein PL9631_640008 [Planktothrix paucivesiculata PCC 9631]